MAGVNKLCDDCERLFHVAQDRNQCLLTIVERWHVSYSEHLIAVGADVNTKKDDITPLMRAFIEENIECVKLLLTAGADVNKYS